MRLKYARFSAFLAYCLPTTACGRGAPERKDRKKQEEQERQGEQDKQEFLSLLSLLLLLSLLPPPVHGYLF